MGTIHRNPNIGFSKDPELGEGIWTHTLSLREYISINLEQRKLPINELEKILRKGDCVKDVLKEAGIVVRIIGTFEATPSTDKLHYDLNLVEKKVEEHAHNHPELVIPLEGPYFLGLNTKEYFKVPKIILPGETHGGPSKIVCVSAKFPGYRTDGRFTLVNGVYQTTFQNCEWQVQVYRGIGNQTSPELKNTISGEKQWNLLITPGEIPGSISIENYFKDNPEINHSKEFTAISLKYLG